MSDVETLTGPRVTLRAPTLDDAEPLFERIVSDPEVSRYMSWRTHADVDETRRVITDIFNVGGETTWIIELRDGDGPIGVCGWRRPQPHIIDFGYFLGRRWWGQGLMSEVVQLLLDKAKRDPSVYRVTAHCHVDNAGSAALLQRSGLTLEGRMARYAVLPNISTEPQDCLLFGKALR
jgi:[ribosomal protein S5]-alanine N-acetyltransferase